MVEMRWQVTWRANARLGDSHRGKAVVRCDYAPTAIRVIFRTVHRVQQRQDQRR